MAEPFPRSSQRQSFSRRSCTSSPPNFAPGRGAARESKCPSGTEGRQRGVVHFRTARVHNAQVTNDQVPAFQPLTGIYEPSAIQQLPDGRFLVVEDEKSHPLSLVTIGADGSVDSTALTAGLFQMFSEFWKLDDLEGLTLDRAGFVYGITSHSRDDDGDEKKSREKLVRFRVEGKRVVDPKVVAGLKQALTMRHAVLAAAAQVRGRQSQRRAQYRSPGNQPRPEATVDWLPQPVARRSSAHRQCREPRCHLRIG